MKHAHHEPDLFAAGPASSPALAAWRTARETAFRSAAGGDVFASIAQPGDVWTREGDDEESIHAEARQTFQECLDRAADRTRGGARGRILLLPGDAGAGKTHLMAAFRRQVEAQHAGYFVYAPMSTELELRPYLLRIAADCLDKQPPRGGESAWLRLSNALVEQAGVDPRDREALRHDQEYAAPLFAIHDRLQRDLFAAGVRTTDLHADYLLALLALQRREGLANSAAMKYLRGDPLGSRELAWLCSDRPLAGTGEPETLLRALINAVRLFGGEFGGAFILCIDQLEDLYEKGAPQQERFPELVRVLRALSENQPGMLVVVACLEDYYSAMKASLSPADVDRLELDPPPHALRASCTAEQVKALVSRRLSLLDAGGGEEVLPQGADPLFPFAEADVLALQGMRPRQVLHLCHMAWHRAHSSGQPPRIDAPQPADAAIPHAVKPPAAPIAAVPWPQLWNDFRTAWSQPVPEEEAELATLLAAGVNALGQQLRVPAQATATADLLQLQLAETSALAAICNARSQGGGLGRQLASVLQTAAKSARRPVAVRSTEFARSAKAAATQLLGEIAGAEGWRVIFPETDWRALQAWLAFAPQHQDHAGFQAWCAEERPLASIGALTKLVRLELLPVAPAQAEKQEEPRTVETTLVVTPPINAAAAKVADLDPERLPLGETLGLRRDPVYFERSWFPTHVAVLGGTGSGKTTAAMTLLEGLLLRGVPVVLVDRKGDLARYGHAPSLAALAAPAAVQFRERVDVALYTPGQSEGRSLALSVLPAPMPDASSEQLRLLAEESAAALASMLGYREGRGHDQRRAALVAAITVLLELDDQPPTLERLSDLLGSGDPALLAALDGLPPKLLRDLLGDLAAFRRLQARLLSSDAEPLSATRLLGLGEHAPAGGRTRLSVISTKFLGGAEAAQAWVAQLMLEFARFVSATPSRELQGVIMLDEADLYLPAVGKPASKAPVENALRRFRSGGLGVVLATQNPGDFDYRCRDNIGTWLVGGIKETRSLEKLRPAFAGAGAGFLERLSGQERGEFTLVRPDGVTPLRAHRNLLPTDQLPDEDILRAARATRPRE